MPGNTEINSDGLAVRFGRDQGARGSRAGVTRTAGKISELVLTVELTGAARTIFTMDRNNDGTLDGFAVGLDTPIPANAKIISVDEIVNTAAAGTTPDHTVGTFQVDGTVIDADGLIVATTGADGALVGTEVAQDSYVSVVTTGTHTAGNVTLVVRYMTV